MPTADGVDDALLLVLGIWWACEKDIQQLKSSINRTDKKSMSNLTIGCSVPFSAKPSPLEHMSIFGDAREVFG